MMSCIFSYHITTDHLKQFLCARQSNHFWILVEHSVNYLLDSAHAGPYKVAIGVQLLRRDRNGVYEWWFLRSKHSAQTMQSRLFISQSTSSNYDTWNRRENILHCIASFKIRAYCLLVGGQLKNSIHIGGIVTGIQIRLDLYTVAQTSQCSHYKCQISSITSCTHIDTVEKTLKWFPDTSYSHEAKSLYLR